jgi:hypothetical protein
MKGLAEERDAARKALHGAHTVTRKEREELLQCKRALSEMEIQLRAMEQETARVDKTAQKAIMQARSQALSSSVHREVCCVLFQHLCPCVVDVWAAAFARCGRPHTALAQCSVTVRSAHNFFACVCRSL